MLRRVNATPGATRRGGIRGGRRGQATGSSHRGAGGSGVCGPSGDGNSWRAVVLSGPRACPPAATHGPVDPPEPGRLPPCSPRHIARIRQVCLLIDTTVIEMMPDRFASRHYDIFVSYAHSDNDGGIVTQAVQRISSLYKKITGDQLRVFFDTSEIITSELWESKIRISMRSSKMLLAFLSPSYVKSEWCRKEWEITVHEERNLRRDILLPDHVGIIFPVLLHPLKRGHFNPADESFLSEATRRQYFDFSSEAYNQQVLEIHVRRLVEQLVDSVDEILRLSRSHLAAMPVASYPDTIIIDHRNKLMWTGFLSDHAMEFEEAKAFAAKLTTAGYMDWHLPTVDELKTLIDPKRVEDKPESEAYPYVEPFNVRRSGCVFSSTIVHSPVSGEPDYYVMHLRNAHIFNGAGYKAYVRAVRRIA